MHDQIENNNNNKWLYIFANLPAVYTHTHWTIFNALNCRTCFDFFLWIIPIKEDYWPIDWCVCVCVAHNEFHWRWIRLWNGNHCRIKQTMPQTIVHCSNAAESQKKCRSMQLRPNWNLNIFHLLKFDNDQHRSTIANDKMSAFSCCAFQIKCVSCAYILLMFANFFFASLKSNWNVDKNACIAVVYVVIPFCICFFDSFSCRVCSCVFFCHDF